MKTIPSYDIWKPGTVIQQPWGTLTPGGGRMVHITLNGGNEGLKLYNKLRSGPYSLCPVQSCSLKLEYDYAYHKDVMRELNGRDAPVPRLSRLMKKGEKLD